MRHRLLKTGALLAWLFLAGFEPVFAQLTQLPLSLGADFARGVLTKHSPSKMLFELPDPVRTFTLEVMHRSQGRAFWSAVHRRPSVGFAGVWHRFGNDSVLGSAVGLYPQMDVFLLRSRPLQVYVRIGYGLVWVTRPFDRISNPGNTAIGSSLNNISTAGISADLRIAQRLRLHIGGAATHVSNGRLILPNLGLNTFTLRAGLRYDFGETVFEKNRHRPKQQQPWTLNARIGLGGAEEGVAGGPFYPVYAAAIFAAKQYCSQSRLHIGLDVAYNTARATYLQDQQLNHTDIGPGWNPLRYSLFVSNEFLFGRVGMMVQGFFYLNPPLKGAEFMGFRLGPNLYLHEMDQHARFNPFIGVYMKAHANTAQYVEMAAGMSF